MAVMFPMAAGALPAIWSDSGVGSVVAGDCLVDGLSGDRDVGGVGVGAPGSSGVAHGRLLSHVSRIRECFNREDERSVVERGQ
jgi:hypothetical protein